MNAAVDFCPHCQAPKPTHFLVCRVCWKEVPFLLWAAFKTAVGLHHHAHITDSRLAAAKAKVLSHLKQFSSAIP